MDIFGIALLIIWAILGGLLYFYRQFNTPRCLTTDSIWLIFWYGPATWIACIIIRLMDSNESEEGD